MIVALFLQDENDLPKLTIDIYEIINDIMDFYFLEVGGLATQESSLISLPLLLALVSIQVAFEQLNNNEKLSQKFKSWMQNFVQKLIDALFPAIDLDGGGDGCN